jgi:integral membrane sensor domain MASE1
MKWLGSLLLVGVFLRHDTSQWLPGYSPAAWFYVLGGLWEITLCASLLIWVSQTSLLTAALWIGILEGAQVSVCRLATKDIDAVHGQNLCDALTGLPVGATMTALYLGIVCVAIGKAWRKNAR